MKNTNLNNQEEYWETNYTNKPKMFGLTPSFAAEEALKVFKKKNISNNYLLINKIKIIFSNRNWIEKYKFKQPRRVLGN